MSKIQLAEIASGAAKYFGKNEYDEVDEAEAISMLLQYIAGIIEGNS